MIRTLSLIRSNIHFSSGLTHSEWNLRITVDTSVTLVVFRFLLVPKTCKNLLSNMKKVKMTPLSE